MQSTDREEFKNQLTILCAAFDRPIADREEAYWKGLAKMSLLEFARVVEFCCGETAPDKLPTPKQCWLLLRQVKAKTPAMLLGTSPKARIGNADNLAFFANRIMLRYLIGSHPIDVQATQKIKNRLVKDFAAFARASDPDATKAEYVRLFIAAVKKITPMTLEQSKAWQEIIDDARGQIAIPPSYAEGIDSNGVFEFA